MRSSGVTLVEMLTLVVALVVIAAVAIPLWRTHELRSQRRQAIEVLQAIQAAQDKHFGQHARYADAGSLNVEMRAPRYTFEVKRSDDALAYVATALAVRTGDDFDARCARLGIDQHGRQSALDDTGKDSTADCWARR